jgi:hypothetical protein
VFGTGKGCIVLWRYNRGQAKGRESELEEIFSKKLGNGEELTALSWDRATEGNLRLVNGTRDGLVQSWIFNGKSLDPRFSVKLAGIVPKNVDFVDNARSDLFVFGTFNGRWYVLITYFISCRMKIFSQAPFAGHRWSCHIYQRPQ